MSGTSIFLLALCLIIAAYACYERTMHKRYKKAYIDTFDKLQEFRLGDATRKEPMPKNEEGQVVFELVEDDLLEQIYAEASRIYDAKRVVDDLWKRAEVGKQKYGQYLRTHNGRDALVDAYQEALDLTVYLRQAKEEDLNEAGTFDASINTAYKDALSMAIWLEGVLNAREPGNA